MKKYSIWIVCLILSLVAVSAFAALPEEEAAAYRASMKQGAAWLAAQQHEEGYWANATMPAMTALAMWALHEAAYPDQAAIDRAMNFVLSCGHPDGSFWVKPSAERRGGGLANYNTSVCMAALHALGRPELVPVIQQSRKYVAGTQHLANESSVYYGGMGYDPDSEREYADLSNSFMAYEAMRMTEDVEDLRREGDEKADLDWDAVQAFLGKVQNLPSVNTLPWVTDDVDDQGGFIYNPGATHSEGKRPAGPPPDGAATPDEASRPPRPPRDAADAPRPATAPAPEGERITLRSYGSMTYAGLLSLIYANVSEDDERVKSAHDWATRHWTLDENPGMGPQGLYYFFKVLSKALDTMGDEVLDLPDGRKVTWRHALGERLLALQQEDGSWVNDNNRWWEADANLVTAYIVLTLSTILDEN